MRALDRGRPEEGPHEDGPLDALRLQPGRRAGPVRGAVFPRAGGQPLLRRRRPRVADPGHGTVAVPVLVQRDPDRAADPPDAVPDAVFPGPGRDDPLRHPRHRAGVCGIRDLGAGRVQCDEHPAGRGLHEPDPGPADPAGLLPGEREGALPVQPEDPGDEPDQRRRRHGPDADDRKGLQPEPAGVFRPGTVVLEPGYASRQRVDFLRPAADVLAGAGGPGAPHRDGPAVGPDVGLRDGAGPGVRRRRRETAGRRTPDGEMGALRRVPERVLPAADPGGHHLDRQAGLLCAGQQPDRAVLRGGAAGGEPGLAVRPDPPRGPGGRDRLYGRRVSRQPGPLPRRGPLLRLHAAGAMGGPPETGPFDRRGRRTVPGGFPAGAGLPADAADPGRGRRRRVLRAGETLPGREPRGIEKYDYQYFQGEVAII